jgi:hypothetical protein
VGVGVTVSVGSGVSDGGGVTEGVAVVVPVAVGVAVGVTVGDGVKVGSSTIGTAVGGGKGFSAMLGSLMIKTMTPNTATVRITKTTVMMSNTEAFEDPLSCDITYSQLTQI